MSVMDLSWLPAASLSVMWLTRGSLTPKDNTLTPSAATTLPLVYTKRWLVLQMWLSSLAVQSVPGHRPQHFSLSLTLFLSLSPPLSLHPSIHPSIHPFFYPSNFALCHGLPFYCSPLSICASPCSRRSSDLKTVILMLLMDRVVPFTQRFLEYQSVTVKSVANMCRCAHVSVCV